MSFYKDYLILEVEAQKRVDFVEVNNGDTDYGYEPQSVLVLKEYRMIPAESLAAILHGEAALHRFQKGDIVAVALRFSKVKKNHEYMTLVDVEDIKLVQDLKKVLL